jgi:hypothetical protein
VPPASRVLEAAKAAKLLSAGKRVADFATDISVEDYLGGKSLTPFYFYYYYYYLFVDTSQGRTRANLL